MPARSRGPRFFFCFPFLRLEARRSVCARVSCAEGSGELQMAIVGGEIIPVSIALSFWVPVLCYLDYGYCGVKGMASAALGILMLGLSGVHNLLIG